MSPKPCAATVPLKISPNLSIGLKEKPITGCKSPSSTLMTGPSPCRIVLSETTVFAADE
jgi:hypothetical protein